MITFDITAFESLENAPPSLTSIKEIIDDITDEELKNRLCRSINRRIDRAMIQMKQISEIQNRLDKTLSSFYMNIILKHIKTQFGNIEGKSEIEIKLETRLASYINTKLNQLKKA